MEIILTPTSAIKNEYAKYLIRLVILLYWSLYWLFNALDKVIGGSQFLWVGRDRFALFERFFASAGWGSPALADGALIVVAALEIFAFLFFAGALLYLLLKKPPLARSWFVVGITLTLSIFTIFSIGDQIFGDHAELLEHALYWMLGLFSWVIFIHAEKFSSSQHIAISQQQLIFSGLLFTGIALAANVSIFRHENNSFYERKAGVLAVREGDNLYKCTFPFLAGSTSFEKTLELFNAQHPGKKIIQVYTVPTELREEQADALIIYLTTADKK